ncbi:MAG: SCO family protein [Gallionella sp.]
MMSNKHNDEQYTRRMPKLSFGVTVALSLLLGQSVPTNAADEHDHHQHHKAAATETKGYVRTLANYKIPEVSLVDSEGKESLLSEAISPNKPVMLNFIFTTCTAICPIMSAAFAQVAQQLGAENEALQLVSISVDPEQDTPEKLKEYAQQFGAGTQWRFFTGTISDSIHVQRAFDAYRGDKMSQVPLTFIRDANTTQWVRIDGLASAADLVKEFRVLAAQ